MLVPSFNFTIYPSIGMSEVATAGSQDKVIYVLKGPCVILNSVIGNGYSITFRKYPGVDMTLPHGLDTLHLYI